MTNDVFGIEEEVENHFRALQDVSAAHPHQPVQEQNALVNPTSLSNHHEQNTVHEEHPPVAENTPPPLARDDDLNAKYFLQRRRQFTAERNVGLEYRSQTIRATVSFN